MLPNSRKTSFSAFVWLLILIAVNGCSDDVRKVGLFREGTEEAIISYSITKTVTIRSGEDNGWESSIDHAYLLFYDASTEVSSMPLAAARAEVKDEMPGSLIFKMPLRLKENVDYKVIAIANADAYVPNGFENYESYLNNLFFNPSESDSQDLKLHYDDRIEAGGSALLPMIGAVSDNAPFRFSITNGVYHVEASLVFRRSVARVDLTNNVAGFVVESVALCNWRDGSGITDNGDYHGVVRGVLTSDDEEFSDDMFIPFPIADEAGVRKLAGEIYCFPSLTLDSRQGDESTTALILKAKYGEDADFSYYRVNLGVNGGKAELKGNTKYNVVIQSVKGRGAPTALEAYTSSESLVVLSVVEEWDLEGSFSMDDHGNFIVLSKGMLEFSCEGSERQEVKVLASKGLDWNVQFFALDANDEASSSAFEVVRLDNSTLSITTKGANNTKQAFIGYCRVSANTSEGTILAVDISVIQPTSGNVPFDPALPENVEVALVPLTDSHVKVDHENRIIEIDGFAPEVFNSFIDVPFMLYISDKVGKDKEMLVDYGDQNKLSWPLEGRISKAPSADYFYCPESFTAQSVYSKSESALKTPGQVTIGELLLKDMESFYISVGAMAPDDPEIVRTVKIKISGEDDNDDWNYTLKIKPRTVIIDDVIVTDENGDSWVIMDRNLQDLSNNTDYIGRDINGYRRQAYHYCGWKNMAIPFKRIEIGTSGITKEMAEDYHSENAGFSFYISIAWAIEGTGSTSKDKWMNKYVYKDGMKRSSPFYELSNYNEWTYPNKNLLEVCRSKMSVSKLRMFLVSEIPAIKDGAKIPICCYFPYNSTNMMSTDINTHGYFAVETSLNDTKNLASVIMYALYTNTMSEVSNLNNQRFVVRFVRPLQEADLNNYKQNYLGYGSNETHLQLCHSDTYPLPDFTVE